MGKRQNFSNQLKIFLTERRMATESRTEHLRNLGYTVIEKYECEVRKQLKEDPNLLQKVLKHPIIASGKLEPRDALYGGRTGCSRLYKKFEGDEEGAFADVVSMYPFAMFYGR